MANTQDNKSVSSQSKNVLHHFVGPVISINDVREKDLDGFTLSDEERLALANFDRFRIAELNRMQGDEAFHKRYMQLQVMANLSPYQEFLRAEYQQD